MIVACERCSTRFQLDDSRIPAKGIRVRCSRCKHAFFLTPPGASENETIHAAAEEAAVEEAVSTPESTRDLGASAAGPGDEEDWQFNVDVPAPDTETGSAASEAGERAPAAKPEEREQVAPAFGADDLEEGGLDDVVARRAEAFGEAQDFAGEPPSATAAPETAPAAAREAVGARIDGPPSEEGLGDPEQWDFFGDGGPDAARPAPDPLASMAARISDAGALADLEGSALGVSSSAEGPIDTLSEPALGDGRLGRALQVASAVVGWVVVAGLVWIGLERGVLPELRPSAYSGSDLSLGSLEARNVSSHWLETARAGELLVVRGELYNPGPEPVRVADSDALGIATPSGASFGSGPLLPAVPLAEGLLREAEPSVLLAARVGAAAQLSAMVVPPGRTLEFEVSALDVPLEARRIVALPRNRPGVAPGRVVGSERRSEVAGAEAEAQAPEGITAGTAAPLR